MVISKDRNKGKCLCFVLNDEIFKVFSENRNNIKMNLFEGENLIWFLFVVYRRCM